MTTVILTGVTDQSGHILIKADPATGALYVVDEALAAIHEGRRFSSSHSSLLEDAEVLEVRFKTPYSNKRYHFTLIVDCALAAIFEVWIDTTKTHVPANVIYATNRDHALPPDPDVEICHTPAGSQAGDPQYGPTYLGATNVPGLIAISGQTGGRAENIFRRNTAYLIKITSRVAGNAVRVIGDYIKQKEKGFQTTTSTTTPVATTTTTS